MHHVLGYSCPRDYPSICTVHIEPSCAPLTAASCTSVQKSKLQRSCPGCNFPDITMGSLSTIPTLVSCGTEEVVSATKDTLSAIEDHTTGGSEPSPHRTPIGYDKRHVYMVFFNLVPPLKCSPVPRMCPSMNLQEERVTLCNWQGWWASVAVIFSFI